MSEITRQEQPVICRQEGALGRITLNRPAALNALNAAMRAAIAAALASWERDPMIYAVVIDAEGDRAFCAGGDLHEMYRMAKDAPEEGHAAAAAEYALNWQIECYTKPIVSLIDGLCMGSGVGLTAYGTHRVAGTNYTFAMPETAIGFFPDVGATWLLGNLDDNAGLYLGLSGRTIDSVDALRLGLVTHCIAAEQFEEIRGALRDAEPIDALLDDRTAKPEARPAVHDWSLIAHLFDAPTMDALWSDIQTDGAAFSRVLLEELKQKSPLSLAVTYRQLTADRPKDLGEALKREYRQAVAALPSNEFFEGVRALLIDKDNAPEWTHRAVSDVTEADVAPYFSQPASGDLKLPPRPRAIAAIV